MIGPEMERHANASQMEPLGMGPRGSLFSRNRRSLSLLGGAQALLGRGGRELLGFDQCGGVRKICRQGKRNARHRAAPRVGYGEGHARLDGLSGSQSTEWRSGSAHRAPPAQALDHAGFKEWLPFFQRSYSADLFSIQRCAVRAGKFAGIRYGWGGRSNAAEASSAKPSHRAAPTRRSPRARRPKRRSISSGWLATAPPLRRRDR